MSELERLKLLTSQMHLEPSGGEERPELSKRKQDSVYLSHATLPTGKKIPLLKTLLTSVCERDCYYCPFRAGRDFRRASFTPDEYAQVFMYMYRKGIVEGFFLSSGVVNGGVYTQDKLLATAEILRRKHNYQGYMHLKIMPGAERAQVEQAMLLADRLSVNLEAPNSQRLKRLAPHKRFDEELLQPLSWIDQVRQERAPHEAWKGRWPSAVTQFVVGGAGESDLELLGTTQQLYAKTHLTRAYYSAFNPVPETPLEHLQPTPLMRQYRLYQASFLLRDYGFALEDLPLSPEGDLPQHIDPKLAWAQIHLASQPVEINTASRHQLMQVPGIGPKGAASILKIRRQVHFREISQLAKLGIPTVRPAPFILLGGKRPPQQLSFSLAT
jgi:predicted DNA-binding helix-hairpin-helix protein